MLTHYISPIVSTLHQNSTAIPMPIYNHPHIKSLEQSTNRMMSHNQYTLDLTACEYYRASEIILVHGQSDGCDQRQHKTQIGRFSSIQCEETGNTVYTMTIANITSGGSVDCAPEEDNVIFTFSFDPSPPSHCTLTPDSELCNG